MQAFRELGAILDKINPHWNGQQKGTAECEFDIGFLPSQLAKNPWVFAICYLYLQDFSH